MYRCAAICLSVSVLSLVSCTKDSAATDPGQDTTELAGRFMGQVPPERGPEVFAPGIISGGRNDGYVVETPDGQEIFFMEVVTRNNQGFATILHSTVVNGFWTKPTVAPFSGTYSDGPLAIHPDGTRLYFSSVRPIDPAESTHESNIWYVEKVGGVWGEPKSIGRPINGRNNTSGPSVTSSGTLYFTEIASDGRNEIFRSELLDGRYQEPERLPSTVNSSRQQYDSYVAPDESFLIYGAYLRPDTFGETDLYIAFRDEAGTWTQSMNMGSLVNTSGNEGTATITCDTKYIFYSKYNSAENRTDIYWFSKEYIEDLKLGKKAEKGVER